MDLSAKENVCLPGTKKKKKTHLCPTAIEAILLLIKTLRCPAFGAERKQLPLLARDSLA